MFFLSSFSQDQVKQEADKIIDEVHDDKSFLLCVLLLCILSFLIVINGQIDSASERERKRHNCPLHVHTYSHIFTHGDIHHT